MISADDILAMSEAEKYEEVWSHPAYRKVSPGELEQVRAFEYLGCKPGERLNDYGSGPARATKWFQEQGLDVVGIDHAKNAAETDVPIRVATLWNMEGHVEPADYAYCCDVMEHIPPDRVTDVLREIAVLTRKAGWFRIATRRDIMGPRLIGAPLHLTVRDAMWWQDELSGVFPVVEPAPCGPGDAVFKVSFDD